MYLLYALDGSCLVSNLLVYTFLRVAFPTSLNRKPFEIRNVSVKKPDEHGNVYYSKSVSYVVSRSTTTRPVIEKYFFGGTIFASPSLLMSAKFYLSYFNAISLDAFPPVFLVLKPVIPYNSPW
jgi:hypothetical protein